MGLFDSLRDAIRPDDQTHETDAERPEAPKHVDEGAPPEFIDDPSDLEHPTGGKHARRD
jgi:hypothetical protein